ncbi:hypothetical protein PVK06_047183 [Gossypium arboreum]|uniref:DUF4283 domain-containing protein n=1 Tax=Gossypium arboreum TaxID=29729 RepID=A0ABR0MCP4_GOSAR|nr:hypothetical protein PVK06_047183 [Gossypium arboreum]
MTESGGNDGFRGDEISLLAEELIQLSVKSSRVEPYDKPTLICTIWTEKYYNPNSFKEQMKSIWKTRKNLRSNRQDDLEVVMEVIFDRLTKPMERDQIRLTSTPFWIKIGPCLPEFDKKDLLHAIGVTFGGILRSEINGNIEENQKTQPQDVGNKDLRHEIKDDSQLKLVGKMIEMQQKGEIIAKETGWNNQDEDMLKQIRKSSWRRIEPTKVIQNYSEESKLKKRKLIKIEDDGDIEEFQEDANKRVKYDGQVLKNDAEIDMLFQNPNQNRSTATKRQADRAQ